MCVQFKKKCGHDQQESRERICQKEYDTVDCISDEFQVSA